VIKLTVEIINEYHYYRLQTKLDLISSLRINPIRRRNFW